MSINLENMASGEENSHSSEEDIEALNAKYIIETSDQELEEEFSHRSRIKEKRLNLRRNLLKRKMIPMST